MDKFYCRLTNTKAQVSPGFLLCKKEGANNNANTICDSDHSTRFISDLSKTEIQVFHEFTLSMFCGAAIRSSRKIRNKS